MATFGEVRYFLSKTPAGAGVDADVVSRIVNNRYQAIIRHRSWSRLKEIDAMLTTTAVYETGTVTFTEGSNAITGTDTVWTSAMTGRRIRKSGDDVWYVFTFVSPTSGTLDRVYEGEDATDAGYRIYQSVYSLASDAGFLESMRILSLGYDLDQIDLEELDKSDAGRTAYGTPTVYALHEDASSLMQVELYPIPETAFGIPYRYRKTVAELTATSTSILTWVSIECLLAGCEADLLALQKDYAGFQIKEGKFQELLSEMSREDALRTPPRQIRMADRFTDHRMARAYGNDLYYRRWRSFAGDDD